MGFSRYLTSCNGCHGRTTKFYARKNGGKCKVCVHPDLADQTRANNQRKNLAVLGLLIDAGHNAYARECGAYDLPDYA